VNGLESALDRTGLFWARHLLARAIAGLLALGGRERHELELACFAYASVFAVEGVGLVLRRRWAEWLTVVVTGSFLPIEGYELAHRRGGAEVVALALNLAIVGYLLAHLRRREPRHRG
jgi:uncharacterized membrane protein (DUF2068 family)